MGRVGGVHNTRVNQTNTKGVISKAQLEVAGPIPSFGAASGSVDIVLCKMQVQIACEETAVYSAHLTASTQLLRCSERLVVVAQTKKV